MRELLTVGTREMSKITILTIGSRGDIQPFCALALELLDRGYSVTLASSVNFEDFVSKFQIPFAPIAGDFGQLLRTDKGLSLLEGKSNITLIDDELKWQQLLDATEACSDTELLILTPLALWGYHIAEALDVPTLLLSPIPITPTTVFPILKFANRTQQRLPGVLNLFSYRLLEFLSWRSSRRLINRFRQEVLDLHPLSLLGARYRKDAPSFLSPLTIINCYSPEVVPPPNDWPNSVHQGGYLFLDGDEQYEPPQSLMDFISAGEQPIFIGFGSMTSRDPKRLLDVLLEVIEITQQRAVICSGWSGLTAANLPKSIYAIEKVPHDWLFPQVALAIHHGGAGTTAATLRAGIPSIVVPFFADQPAWGKRLEQLGIASPPLPYKELNVEALVDRIKKVKGNEAMKTKAKQLSSTIKAENGVDKVADIIEKHLSQVSA